MPESETSPSKPPIAEATEGRENNVGWRGRLPALLQRYFRRMGGTTRSSPPRVNNSEILWSWIGAFLGIAAVAWIDLLILTEGGDHLPLIGSLGASAVLVYGAPRSPLAQPRNLVGGHVVSALVGVLCQQLVDHRGGLDRARLARAADRTQSRWPVDGLGRARGQARLR